MSFLRPLIALLAIFAVTASLLGSAAWAHDVAPRHAHTQGVDAADCDEHSETRRVPACAAVLGHCATAVLRDDFALPPPFAVASRTAWHPVASTLAGSGPEAETPPPRS